MIRSLYLLSAFLLFANCNNPELKGTVVKVSDGDTFVMLTPAKKQIRVRLYGIDAPERTQDYYNVSKQHLSHLIINKEVTVIAQKTDRYGRIVGIVLVGDKKINEDMIKSGLAWHYDNYDQNPRWERLEIEARKNKKGIWSKVDPVPPWEFRKIKRKQRK